MLIKQLHAAAILRIVIRDMKPTRLGNEVSCMSQELNEPWTTLHLHHKI